jgi:hypothetical protein
MASGYVSPCSSSENLDPSPKNILHSHPEPTAAVQSSYASSVGTGTVLIFLIELILAALI